MCFHSNLKITYIYYVKITKIRLDYNYVKLLAGCVACRILEQITERLLNYFFDHLDIIQRSILNPVEHRLLFLQKRSIIDVWLGSYLETSGNSTR